MIISSEKSILWVNWF